MKLMQRRAPRPPPDNQFLKAYQKVVQKNKTFINLVNTTYNLDTNPQKLIRCQTILLDFLKAVFDFYKEVMIEKDAQNQQVELKHQLEELDLNIHQLFSITFPLIKMRDSQISSDSRGGHRGILDHERPRRCISSSSDSRGGHRGILDHERPRRCISSSSDSRGGHRGILDNERPRRCISSSSDSRGGHRDRGQQRTIIEENGNGDHRDEGKIDEEEFGEWLGTCGRIKNSKTDTKILKPRKGISRKVVRKLALSKIQGKRNHSPSLKKSRQTISHRQKPSCTRSFIKRLIVTAKKSNTSKLIKRNLPEKQKIVRRQIKKRKWPVPSRLSISARQELETKGSQQKH